MLRHGHDHPSAGHSVANRRRNTGPALMAPGEPAALSASETRRSAIGFWAATSVFSSGSLPTSTMRVGDLSRVGLITQHGRHGLLQQLRGLLRRRPDGGEDLLLQLRVAVPHGRGANLQSKQRTGRRHGHDHRPVAATHLEDRAGLDVHAAVGERRVRRGQLEHRHLLGAEGERGVGLEVRADPGVARHVDDRVHHRVPVPRHDELEELVDGTWIAVGQVFPDAAIWTSEDGRTWDGGRDAIGGDLQGEVVVVTGNGGIEGEHPFPLLRDADGSARRVPLRNAIEQVGQRLSPAHPYDR